MPNCNVQHWWRRTNLRGKVATCLCYNQLLAVLVSGDIATALASNETNLKIFIEKFIM